MPQTDLQLDVRTIPPPQRHSEIFRTFDSLQPEQAFVLVNDHNPKPLLYQFQAERPSKFEWSVLEAGPDTFRIRILRRAEGGSRSVSEYLQGDHHRLDAILQETQARVQAGDFKAAGAAFGEFKCGLNWHIDVEEQVLFPTFEASTGMSSGGPTVVMRHEHVLIRGAMDEASAGLAAADAGRFATAVSALLGVLGEHNMKEEQILYPMTDRAAGGDRERDDLVKKMQAN